MIPQSWNHAGPRAECAGEKTAVAYKWWVILMLWAICLFNYADRQAISSVFPKLKEEFHFNDLQLGLIASAFMWVYAFAAPLAGFIGDRVRRKNLIIGGFLFWSGITVMTGWCGKVWQFVAVRASEGFGETFYYPAAMSLASDYHGPKTRSLALSLHQTAVYAGTIAGSWAGAWFAERLGWRFGFYFFGASGLVLACVLALFLREPVRGASDPPSPSGPPITTHQSPTTNLPPSSFILHPSSFRPPAPPPSFPETLRAIARSPAALILLIVFPGANFVSAVFMTWTPTFLVEKFGFKLAEAGLSGSVFIYLACAAGSPVAGWLADRLSRRMVGGRILVQALGLGAGTGFIFLVGMTPNVSTLLLSMTGFGLCKGFYDSNIFASMFDFVEPGARGAATGLMNMTGWFGGALGPVYLGWAALHGRHASEMANMSEAIAWCAPIYLAGSLLLFAAIFLSAKRGIIQTDPPPKA
jgi:MFS family permease